MAERTTRPRRAKPKFEAKIEVETVALADLVLDDRNARRGDVDALMASLSEFGQHRPAVVQRATKKVLAGNHLVLAARALGWDSIAVAWVDDDDETAKRRALADNLVGDRATWDETQLKSLLTELDDAGRRSLPGMDDKMLDKLLAEVGDDTGDAPVMPINARPGEHYDYVVVVAMNEMDNAWLREVLGVRSVKSYKSERSGASRVITVTDLKGVLNAAIKHGERMI